MLPTLADICWHLLTLPYLAGRARWGNVKVCPLSVYRSKDRLGTLARSVFVFRSESRRAKVCKSFSTSVLLSKRRISALCRSRRELSNEYLLAKIGVDTAENEPLQVLFNIIQYYSTLFNIFQYYSILFNRVLTSDPLRRNTHARCSTKQLWMLRSWLHQGQIFGQ